MFEAMTYEAIMQNLLRRVPDTLDKREGAIIYDALAPAAMELAILYTSMDTVLDQTFVDTAAGEYLDKRCAERAITRDKATFAVVEGAFTPVNTPVIGQRFSCEKYNYVVSEETDTPGVYKLLCEEAGTGPNGTTGRLIPIQYIPDLETAKITAILVPGEDEESDESLRDKYYEALESQAFGGNVADYKRKTNEIAGVGGVKVTPVWNGGGTVKLTIIASDYSVPTQTLIDTVQEAIDPLQDGAGGGIAPIGHVVTVVAVQERLLDIATNITYESGWDWEACKTYVEAAIDAYFLDLSAEWDGSENLVVRISQIETRLLGCPGVIDVAGTTIDGAEANVILDSDSIPVRGLVNGT